jgi:hypothetical protein
MIARISAADEAPAPASGAKLDFHRDIRPILSAKCFACHGPDPKVRKAKLRLDTPEGALGEAASGAHPVVPGDLDGSELYQRITATDPLERMPPAKSGKSLTGDEIAKLKTWILQGAAYPKHWAFAPPRRPEIPKLDHPRWCKNPVDAFILSRLEKAGLKPAPEADRFALIRRLALDLTGLPPQIEDVDAFVSDMASDAYEQLVERLLASPHYGERWGRHWLDAARYADSDGYEKDKSRFVWFYRDWVVKAFNRDLPYDRFVIEQLAGDQLPDATQDQVVATGFLRNSMVNEEGGIDPEQFRMDAMFDRMDAVGKSILGLTIQCAQCHTHKYDPLTQEEYYRSFAFLNNDYEAQPLVYTPAEQLRIAGLSRQMREIEAGLQRTMPDWMEWMAKWEDSVRYDQPEWVILNPTQVSDADTRFYPQKDRSILGLGYAPTKFTYVFRARTNLKELSAVRLELLTDPNLPAHGPGRSFKGGCALTELRVEAADPAEPEQQTTVKFSSATADYADETRALEANFDDRSGRKRFTGPAVFAIDGKDETAWGIDAGPGRRNTDRKAVFVAEKPRRFPNGAILTFHIKTAHGGWNNNDHQNNNLGRFRLSVTAAKDAKADPLPKRIREILDLPGAQRSAAQVAAVFSYWRTTVTEFKPANDKIEALWKQWPEGTTALALSPRPPGDARKTSVLTRGDWLKPGAEVSPGVPAFLHPLPRRADQTRLTFAKWLVDRKAPTTARVFVNRLWQAYFGTGLVSTPEDFGLQSERPSHPELLDWLACEFMDGGWNVKAMHRLIVSSATYRQQSRISPELGTKDPDNRLVARGPRFRVEAEIVRDIALAASGLLHTKLGGPSIYAPAPEFLFLPPSSYAPFPWKQETGPDRYRRALYTFRRRSTPYPALSAFDAPNGDFSCVRRSRSNTPLQALTALNETVFVECARALARRMLEAGGKTDDDRVAYAFRRVLTRPPTAEERKELLALLEKQKRRIADGWLNPRELATGKDELPELQEGTTPTELAAYTIMSRVLLNLDEAMTKE